MKRLLLPVLLLITLTSFSQPDTLRILFLGNSYTATNNLPSLIDNCLQSLNVEVISQSYTPGGYTFEGHDGNQTSTNLIQQGNWDFVVLQEQSQIPSFPLSQVETECFPFAASLDNKVEEFNPCAQTVFYMTWGRQNGDSQNCPNWPPVCTYEGMDDLLYERYMTMAEDNEALVAPVGAVWRFIRTNYPTINLYSNDGSHPSIAGSYTAALTFATVFTEQDPTSIAFNSTLPSTMADSIKSAVKTVVFDQLPQWNVGVFENTNPLCATTNSNEHSVETEQKLGYWSNGYYFLPRFEKFSKVEFYDLQGRLLHSLRPNSSQIALSLPAGIYLVKGFGISGEIATHRFVNHSH